MEAVLCSEHSGQLGHLMIGLALFGLFGRSVISWANGTRPCLSLDQ